jgi:hypothetical protein
MSGQTGWDGRDSVLRFREWRAVTLAAAGFSARSVA